MVVASGTQKTVLADCSVRPNEDFRYAVAIHTISQTAIVAHLKVPGGPDLRGGVGVHAATQSSAKGS